MSTQKDLPIWQGIGPQQCTSVRPAGLQLCEVCFRQFSLRYNSAAHSKPKCTDGFHVTSTLLSTAPHSGVRTSPGSHLGAAVLVAPQSPHAFGRAVLGLLS